MDDSKKDTEPKQSKKPDSKSPKRRLRAVTAGLLAAGLLFTGLGVTGVVLNWDAFADGTIDQTALTPVELPTGEIVYNERMSAYRPSVDSLAADEATEQIFVANEVMVMFKAGVTPAQAGAAIAKWGGTVVGHLTAINRYEVVFPEKRSLSDLKAYTATLQADPSVEIAYVNLMQSVTSEETNPTNDTGWAGDWNGAKTVDGNWGMEAINAPTLWGYADEISKGVAATPVGILDAGFSSNADVSVDVLSPNTEDNHGTHVAGTIGAKYNNKEGVSGVVPAGVKMYGFPTYSFNYSLLWDNRKKALLEASQTGDVNDLYQRANLTPTASSELGLVYLVAERKARVVNYSMGFGSSLLSYAASRGNSAAVKAYESDSEPAVHLINALARAGHDFLLVTSAGNSARQLNRTNTGCGWFACDELYVEDRNAEYGYRTAGSGESEFATGGNITASFNSLFTFIGSSADSRADSAAAKEARKHIVVVGAAGQSDKGLYAADFSDRGDRVDLYAPGVGIESTIGVASRNAADAKEAKERTCGSVLCATWDGTSMATPHVTGTADALWAMDPTMSSQEVRQRIKDSLQSGDSACSGNCFLDAGAAATKLHDDLANEQASSGVTPGGAYLGSGDTITSMVFDTSGSMSSSSGRTQTVDLGNGETDTQDVSKINAAKEAGQVLLKTIKATAARSGGNYQIGVAQFADSSSMVLAPTADYAGVANAISGLTSNGGTNLVDAIDIGASQLSGQRGLKVMILLSDGKDESGNSDDTILAEAKTAAAEGVKICTVGFGETGDLNEALLKQVATSTGCSYSYADSASAVALAGSFISAQLQATSTVIGQSTGTVGGGPAAGSGTGSSTSAGSSATPGAGTPNTGIGVQTSQKIQLKVPNQTGDLTAVLYSPSTNVEVVLTDAAGKVVDARYAGVTIDTSQMPVQVTITDPKQGSWTLEVRGKDAKANGQPFYTVAAFKPVEREYLVNQVPQLTLPTPEAVAIAPDLTMTLAAVSLGAGVFLGFLGATMLLVGVTPPVKQT
jgi:hypothetical protein